MNTSLTVKQRLLPKFFASVAAILRDGGKKYKGTTLEKEWTDTIMEFDPNFMLATILKYTGRVRNGDPRSEQDLAKIAAYAFLQWVKLYGEQYVKDSK